MQPFIIHRTVTLPEPSDTDRRAHDQRLRDVLGIPDLEIPLAVLREIPHALERRRSLPCAVAQIHGRRRLIDVDADRSYSIGLDLGSTNLAAVLHDNIRRKDVLTRSLENPQVAFGSDILTRMHHAMHGNGEDIYRVLTNGVNELIAELCREAQINTQDIHGMAAAGNTAMTHFLLGLDVGTIPVAPWVPVVRKPGFLRAEDLGISLHPAAPVYLFPNAGSYVGGDITAGILAAGMHTADEPCLLVDVGTNAEVVIGNREWLIVGAGAAGPALEEGISAIGKRATSGIVYDVEITEQAIFCRTFDQEPPHGICGSGMISLLYEMHQAGIIDQTGTFTTDPRVRDQGGEKVFPVSCDGSDALVITQTEIRNFMRSKAAMFTLLLALTRSVGISFRDVKRVYVSGALGTGIDVRKAAGIGMVPAWPPDIVQALGNTSLAGCRMLLEDASLAAEADRLVDRITYKHMHDDPEFMKEFRGADFIPHTDPELLKI